MFKQLIQVIAAACFVFFGMTCDSLPTPALVVVLFICLLAFFGYLINQESLLEQNESDLDTPIAEQVAREQGFDLSSLDLLDKNEQFRRDFDKEL
jgi:hypothetical protein